MRALLLTGFVSVVAQVALLRELSVAFYGLELIYVVALGGWMAWTAAGAALDRGRRAPPALAAIAALLAAAGGALVAGVIALRGLRRLLGEVPGAYLPLLQQLLAVALVLLPVGLLLGLLFQWAARRAVAGGRTLGWAYAVESAGAVAGGVAATVAVVAGVQTWALALGGALVCALGAARLTPGPARLVWFGLALVTGASLAISPRTDAAMTRWNHPQLVASRDSPYGRITVTKAEGQVTFFENDALAFESAGTEAEAFVHPAALAHPAPRRVLLLGGTPAGFLDAVLAHRPALVEAVELNRVLLALAHQFAPPAGPGAAPRTEVRLVVDDPRRFVSHGARYDLVLVGMPEPDSGQANRFYTREFFDACRARLAPGGILALRLRVAENFWTPGQLQRLAAVVGALEPALPHVLVLPGVPTVLLASGRPLPGGPEPLERRLAERHLEARLVGPAYLRYVFENDRRRALGDAVRRERVPPNTDARPVCYRYALVLWLGRFSPALARLDLAAVLAERPWVRPAVAGAGLVVAVLLLVVRRAPRAGRLALVAAAAFAGMLVETTVLLHYQLKWGVVYERLGLLLTAFMGGLALGTWAAVRATAAAGRPGRARAVGALAVVTLAAASAASTLAAALSLDTGLTAAASLLVAAGGSVGAVFAAATRAAPVDDRRAIGPFYAADLAGGCAGALVGGLLLVPAAGVDVTAGLAALVALACLALV